MTAFDALHLAREWAAIGRNSARDKSVSAERLEAVRVALKALKDQEALYCVLGEEAARAIDLFADILEVRVLSVDDDRTPTDPPKP